MHPNSSEPLFRSIMNAGPNPGGKTFRIALHAALLAFLFTVGGAHAQSQLDEGIEESGKNWQEIALQLPPAPADKNLVPFEVSATTNLAFAIDSRSVSVGSDGVIRYTLVATSAAGARTVSHEGIRCLSFERKLYAFGRPDGSWSRARNDRWEPIVRNAANRQHAVLAQDYFCENKVVSGSAEKMVDRIRWKRPLNPRSERF